MAPTHYRRKPTTVEAFQWHTGDDLVYDLRGNLIDTRDGDYVLRDTVSGEVETIEESWFQANYEQTDAPNVVPGTEQDVAEPAPATSGTVVPPQPPPTPIPQATVTEAPEATQIPQAPSTAPVGGAPSTAMTSGGGSETGDDVSQPSTPTGVIPGQ